MTSELWPIKAGVINPRDAKEKVPGPLIHNAAAPISVSITINRNASLIFRSGGQPPSSLVECAFSLLQCLWNRWNKGTTNEKTNPINRHYKPVLYWGKWCDETNGLKAEHLFIGNWGIGV